MKKEIICGIYKITSPSGKIYIGESKNIHRRWKDYKGVNRCKKQTKLFNSLIKHGVENHVFEIVEECDFTELICRERFWQEEFDTLNKGLNLKLSVCGEQKQITSDVTKQKIAYYNTNFKVYTKETRNKISLSKKGLKRDSSLWDKKHIPKKVYQYNEFGMYVKEWRSTKEIANFYNLKVGTINSNLYNKCYNKKHLFFLSFQKFENVTPYKNLKNTGVIQYTRDLIFVKEWDSVLAATKYLKLKSVSSISNVLTGASSTAGGFVWKYKNK